MSGGQYDDTLFGILNHVGGIDRLIDAVFSFLHRRTDFFEVKRSDSDRGLPPGVARKIVNMLCKKYIEIEMRKANISGAVVPKPAQQEKVPEKAENVLSKTEVCEENASEEVCNKKIISKDTKDDGSRADVDSTKDDDTRADVDSTKDDDTKADVDSTKDDDTRADGDSTEEDNEKQDSTPNVEDKDAKNEDPERRYYDANPECYNGASYENYSWSQDIYHLEVQVKVPKNIKSSNHVKVKVEPTHLKVEVFEEEQWKSLLDGDLSYKIKLEDSTWTLFPGQHVSVHMEKGYERYWEALVQGEPKINVRAIDCSKPYEDLDEEARAKLQEMMFDQHQKRLGKPTSQQIKVQEMMKQAWNQNNSPFKGQPFDPTRFNIAQ